MSSESCSEGNGKPVFHSVRRSISNPAELVANGRLKILLNRVEALFDWIIIDSPPAVPVSDASLLANYCDGVLMVVRSNARRWIWHVKLVWSFVTNTW
jgi:cellulose biosynthesis protein BcsQ